MFGYNDEFTLTGLNAIGKDGKMLNFVLPFPFSKDNLNIPKDLVQIDIFESHYDHEAYGFIAFKVCIGEVTSIMEMVEQHKVDEFSFVDEVIFNEIKNSYDKLCYYVKENGKKVIFAIIGAGDIVTKDEEEFKDVLANISDNYQNIKDSVVNIRKMSL